jgi:stress-induced morphogen
MDKALTYYNCYTNITKSLNVVYEPSVQTADGNINGSLRFGSNTTYMDYRTAMHEIGHTVGIGQASNWSSFISNGLFTGSNAAAQLRAINATLQTPLYTDVHADTQHFWPYGLNQQSEAKSEADLISHCQMVVAIRKDLGLQ